jgi:hypothetical protein
VVEAKVKYLNTHLDHQVQLARINRVLTKAYRDAKTIPSDGSIRLAVFFLAPRFRLSNDADREIGRWLRLIKRVRTSAQAFVFPPPARKTIIWEGQYYFPGVVLLIKKVV